MKAGAGAAFAVACSGIALFSMMDAVMKQQSLLIGAYSAMLWRSVFGIVLSGAVFFGSRTRWPTARVVRLHAMRGAAASLSVVLFFWGLVRLPLAQGVALSFIAPLVALYLAAVMLGEKVGRRAITGSIVAFGGVLLIVAMQARGDMGPEALKGAAAILVAALFYAVSMVLLRRQAQAAGPIEVAFFSNLVGLVLYTSAAPWLLVAPVAGEWPWLALAAVLAFVSILALAWAYARAEANYLAPVEYTAFAWASLLGWLVFDEAVSVWTVAGAAMIVTGCVIAARRQIDAVPVVESGI